MCWERYDKRLLEVQEREAEETPSQTAQWDAEAESDIAEPERVTELERELWGEVWRLDAITEAEGCVIVSENSWNEAYPTVFVVRLVTGIEENPGPGHTLVSESPRTFALCDELATMHERRLVERVGELSAEQMELIDCGLVEVKPGYRVLATCQ